MKKLAILTILTLLTLLTPRTYADQFSGGAGSGYAMAEYAGRLDGSKGK